MIAFYLYLFVGSLAQPLILLGALAAGGISRSWWISVFLGGFVGGLVCVSKDQNIHFLTLLALDVLAGALLSWLVYGFKLGITSK